jgi:hypothetical protein
MLAERYAATRGKLLHSFDAVAAIAAEVGVAISPQWNIDALRETLDRPFLFTVCGEINAGKSSLINAIMGQYLCRVNALPETDRPTLHGWGEQRRETDHGGKWREFSWPHDSLRPVHWLDLPGVDAVGKTASQDWLPWLEASDALLVVFPFRNPWGAPTWDFLARLPETVLASTAFVLQQCDEGQATDIPVMLGHLRELSQKRLGLVPTVFAVSARQGFEAKTQVLSAELLSSCGLPSLENWLENRIHHCPERRQALESLRRAALGILYEIEEELDQTSRKVQSDVRFLDGIEREISVLQQSTLQQQMQGLGAIGEVFSQQSHGMARLLQGKLGIVRSIVRLMRGDDTAQRLELLLQERLTPAVKAAAARDMVELIGTCATHWQSVTARVEAQIGAMPAKWPEIETRLQESREHFVERMGRTALSNVGQLRVRGVLDAILRERNASLSVWIGLCSVMLIIAGVTGALWIPWVPQVASAVAFVLFVFLAVFCVRSAREIVSDYRNRLLLSADVFFTALRGDYEEGLRMFFRQYAQGLESVRKTLVQRGATVQPLLQRWNELFLEIKAVEQEMAE